MKLMKCLALAAVSVCIATPAYAESLTVVNWGGPFTDAFRTALYKPFTDETGIAVAEDTWNGGVGTLRAQVEGGASKWDVIEVEAEELRQGCEEGLFETLDWKAIGNRKDFLPEWSNDCGVGTILASWGLAWDANKQTTAPTSWADFFDLAKFPGKRGFRKGPKHVLEFALLADGVPLNEVYKVLATDEGVSRAFAKLDTIKSSIVFWEGSSTPAQLLASGDVVMTMFPSGRLAGANKSGQNIHYLWNGSQYYGDAWAVLKGSKNVEAATKFLAKWATPRIGADFMNIYDYGVSNVQSAPLVAADRLAILPSAPENLKNALPLDPDFWVENNDKLNARFQEWVMQ
ncbi:MAG: ABC transporter substrate-binding protein [Parvibaculaceae bacterium]